MQHLDAPLQNHSKPPSDSNVVRTFNGVQTNSVLLRLSGFAPLSPVETAVLRNLPHTARGYPVKAELCLPGQGRSQLMLLEGWACDQRILGDGRRQIIRFLLPGDAVSSLDQSGQPSARTVIALTPVVMADASAVTGTSDVNGAPLPGLALALAMMRHADDINICNQIVRLGRHTAYERLVHLMLELHHRLQAVGLADEDSFSLPLTQEILSDALGLSVVHINRTLQQIRRDRLLDLRSGRVTFHEISRMQAVAA